MSPTHSRRIGFVATRIRGSDGVSLEIGKWAEILERMGHRCYYICGESDRPAERSQIIPQAYFRHPAIEEINRLCFGRQVRDLEVSDRIHGMTRLLKEGLCAALRRFDIDLIIAENCVTIPMNIPLGLAMVETTMQTGIECLAHHHDFVWERERFLINAVDDHLHAAFPPRLARLRHVAINSQQAAEFSRRTGLSCDVIPNVMDFDRPPPPADDYVRGFRADIGLGEADLLILQPTRVIQRKGIEHAIEQVRRLDNPRCKLVITHEASDEGDDYARRVQQYARMLGVEVIYAQPWIACERGAGHDGHRRYTIWDAYAEADIVSYPSTYEGFGNAFLEAVYYRKPILCNRYAIYRTDIEPCGFRPLLMDGYLTDQTVDQVRRVLSDASYRQEMVDHNYATARRYFSYDRAEAALRTILSRPRYLHAHVPVEG